MKKIIQNNILTIFFTCFLILLVIFSKNNLIAAKDGLALWSTCVVPSLFPFFIATELLNYTNISYILGRLLNKFMRPLFNIPGEGAYAFIMGIISGYPIGAKIVSDFYEHEICTKEEAERMIAFTNNSGPLFIIGTVGILLFGSTSTGILLFITHLLSSISVGIILKIIRKPKYKIRNHNKTLKNIESKKIQNKFSKKNIINNSDQSYNYKNNKNSSYIYKNTQNINLSDLGTILSTSIQNAISTIFLIGGFVVLFSIILSILNNLHIIENISNLLTLLKIPSNYGISLLSGLIELTNGVKLASIIPSKMISHNIILTSFLLGFGGISILFQVYSIISKQHLSIKTYIYGKILQGELSALYTTLLLKLSLFNLDYSGALITNKTSNTILSDNSNNPILFILIFSIILTIFIINHFQNSKYTTSTI